MTSRLVAEPLHEVASQGNANTDWEVMLGGDWHLVGVMERQFLQQLQRDGQSEGVKTLRGYEYKYDLASMTQTNAATGRLRRLRRCVAPSLERQPPSLRAMHSIEVPLNGMVPVILHVYDLGADSSTVEVANGILSAMGSGLYHAAVEIYGLEFSFGYSTSGPGIFSNEPKQCTMHHYRESHSLGTVIHRQRDVDEMLQAMSREWTGPSYDILYHNCCHFSNDFSQRLGTGSIPSWVMSLASVGAKLDVRYQHLREAASKGKEARGIPRLDSQEPYRFGDVTRGVLAIGRDARSEPSNGDSCGDCLRGLGKVCCT